MTLTDFLVILALVAYAAAFPLAWYFTYIHKDKDKK